MVYSSQKILHLACLLGALGFIRCVRISGVRVIVFNATFDFLRSVICGGNRGKGRGGGEGVSSSCFL